MNSAGATTAVRGLTAPRPSRAPLAARILLSMLARIRVGTLSLHLPDGRALRYGSGSPMATLRIPRWRALEDALSGGDIGFAEGYMRGDWESDDLAALLLLLVKNRNAIERAVYGGFMGRLLARLRHLMNANTRTGSRRNIAAHYDLGNDFYRLWLDPSMTYSSALFDGDFSLTLEAAQAAKYRRILERLRPARGARILEIGCGWGGFAEMAAREYGCHVTGLTLSREQLAYATARLARAGLADRVELRLQDYRDLSGQFDHVVSIEMFEAVGERWWPDYFRAVASALKPRGRALIQSITIADALFERYRKGTDFIQQYIFPGGMLPSPSRFRADAAHAGLVVADSHAFGRDYAETLRRWRAGFMAQLPAVREQGFDERFLRMWEFYYCYCEAGFDSGCTDVYQFELVKP
ncbi:MAG: class I SAM-dependent methyltransferase [Burkholderiales bacterium]|nr:class I SAM-dependent methyltransferase [Burkholderiales bacterium]